MRNVSLFIHSILWDTPPESDFDICLSNERGRVIWRHSVSPPEPGEFECGLHRGARLQVQPGKKLQLQTDARCADKGASCTLSSFQLIGQVPLALTTGKVDVHIPLSPNVWVGKEGRSAILSTEQRVGDAQAWVLATILVETTSSLVKEGENPVAGASHPEARPYSPARQGPERDDEAGIAAQGRGEPSLGPEQPAIADTKTGGPQKHSGVVTDSAAPARQSLKRHDGSKGTWHPGDASACRPMYQPPPLFYASPAPATRSRYASMPGRGSGGAPALISIASPSSAGAPHWARTRPTGALKPTAAAKGVAEVLASGESRVHKGLDPQHATPLHKQSRDPFAGSAGVHSGQGLDHHQAQGKVASTGSTRSSRDHVLSMMQAQLTQISHALGLPPPPSQSRVDGRDESVGRVDSRLQQEESKEQGNNRAASVRQVDIGTVQLQSRLDGAGAAQSLSIRQQGSVTRQESEELLLHASGHGRVATDADLRSSWKGAGRSRLQRGMRRSREQDRGMAVLAAGSVARAHVHLQQTRAGVPLARSGVIRGQMQPSTNDEASMTKAIATASSRNPPRRGLGASTLEAASMPATVQRSQSNADADFQAADVPDDVLESLENAWGDLDLASERGTRDESSYLDPHEREDDVLPPVKAAASPTRSSMKSSERGAQASLRDSTANRGGIALYASRGAGARDSIRSALRNAVALGDSTKAPVSSSKRKQSGSRTSRASLAEASQLDVPSDPQEASDVHGESTSVQQQSSSASNSPVASDRVPVIDVAKAGPLGRPAVDMRVASSTGGSFHDAQGNALLGTTGQLSGLMSADSLEVSGSGQQAGQPGESVSSARAGDEDNHSHGPGFGHRLLQARVVSPPPSDSDAAGLLRAGFGSPSAHPAPSHAKLPDTTRDSMTSTSTPNRLAVVEVDAVDPSDGHRPRLTPTDPVAEAGSHGSAGAETASASDSYGSEGFEVDARAPGGNGAADDDEADDYGDDFEEDDGRDGTQPSSERADGPGQSQAGLSKTPSAGARRPGLSSAGRHTRSATDIDASLDLASISGSRSFDFRNADKELGHKSVSSGVPPQSPQSKASSSERVKLLKLPVATPHSGSLRSARSARSRGGRTELSISESGSELDAGDLHQPSVTSKAAPDLHGYSQVMSVSDGSGTGSKYGTSASQGDAAAPSIGSAEGTIEGQFLGPSPSSARGAPTGGFHEGGWQSPQSADGRGSAEPPSTSGVLVVSPSRAAEGTSGRPHYGAGSPSGRARTATARHSGGSRRRTRSSSERESQSELRQAAEDMRRMAEAAGASSAVPRTGSGNTPSAQSSRRQEQASRPTTRVSAGAALLSPSLTVSPEGGITTDAGFSDQPRHLRAEGPHADDAVDATGMSLDESSSLDVSDSIGGAALHAPDSRSTSRGGRNENRGQGSRSQSSSKRATSDAAVSPRVPAAGDSESRSRVRVDSGSFGVDEDDATGKQRPGFLRSTAGKWVSNKSLRSVPESGERERLGDGWSDSEDQDEAVDRYRSSLSSPSAGSGSLGAELPNRHDVADRSGRRGRVGSLPTSDIDMSVGEAGSTRTGAEGGMVKQLLGSSESSPRQGAHSIEPDLEASLDGAPRIALGPQVTDSPGAIAPDASKARLELLAGAEELRAAARQAGPLVSSNGSAFAEKSPSSPVATTGQGGGSLLVRPTARGSRESLHAKMHSGDSDIASLAQQIAAPSSDSHGSGVLDAHPTGPMPQGAGRSRQSQSSFQSVRGGAGSRSSSRGHRDSMNGNIPVSFGQGGEGESSALQMETDSLVDPSGGGASRAQQSEGADMEDEEGSSWSLGRSGPLLASPNSKQGGD